MFEKLIKDLKFDDIMNYIYRIVPTENILNGENLKRLIF